MKVSREELNKIIQEELEALAEETSIDEESLLKKAAGWAKDKAGSFFKGLTRNPNIGSQTDFDTLVARNIAKKELEKPKSSIKATKFTQGPSNSSSPFSASSVSSAKDELPINIEQPKQLDLSQSFINNFKANYDELENNIKDILTNAGAESSEIKSFIKDLSSELNKDLETRKNIIDKANIPLTLKEQQEHIINVSDLIQKHIKNLNIVRIRNILKKVKQFISANEKFKSEMEPSKLSLDFDRGEEPAVDALGVPLDSSITGLRGGGVAKRDDSEKLEENKEVMRLKKLAGITKG